MFSRAKEMCGEPNKWNEMKWTSSNIVACNMMHRLNTLLHDVAWSLIWFKLHATSCNRVFKRCNMLHATMLGDVACNMLRSFERAFTRTLLAQALTRARTSHARPRARPLTHSCARHSRIYLLYFCVRVLVHSLLHLPTHLCRNLLNCRPTHSLTRSPSQPVTNLPAIAPTKLPLSYSSLVRIITARSIFLGWQTDDCR